MTPMTMLETVDGTEVREGVDRERRAADQPGGEFARHHQVLVGSRLEADLHMAWSDHWRVQSH